MTPGVQTANFSPRPTVRSESRVRVRYRAPFALRCGALLIDYILLVLILTFSIMVARMLGGGARTAGGTAEKIGIIITLIVAVLDLVVLAGLQGQTARPGSPAHCCVISSDILCRCCCSDWAF